MQQVTKEFEEARLTGRGKPLNFVFIGTRLEAQQLRYTIEEISERIGEVELAYGSQSILPAFKEHSGTEVSGPVESQY